MSGKLRKMLAVLCAAAMLLSTGAMPAMAADATPGEITQNGNDFTITATASGSTVTVTGTFIPKVGNGTVSGLSVDVALGSSSVKNVSITSPNTFTATFDNVAAGIHDVKATLRFKIDSGYVDNLSVFRTTQVTVEQQTPPAEQTTPPAEQTTPPPTEQTPPPITTSISNVQATVSGDQITVTGKAQAGATVSIAICDKDGNAMWSFAHTEIANADGDFTTVFTKMVANEYKALAQYQDGSHVMYANGNTSFTVGTPAPVANPITISSIEGGEEKVVVTGTADNGTNVEVTLAANGSTYTASDTSDGQYSVSVPGLPAGTYEVDVSVKSTNTAAQDIAQRKTVTVNAKQTNLTVMASYDATSGNVTVSGTGKANAQIIIDIGTKSRIASQVDSQGNYGTTAYVEGEGNDMKVVVAYLDPSVGDRATTTVDIPVPPKAVDIDILSVKGGVNQIVIEGTGKESAVVEATVGGVTAQQTVKGNNFSLTLTGVPKGSYKDIVVKYPDGSNGKSKTWTETVTVTDPVTLTDISITTVKPEVGKVTIIGTAKAGERVVASMVTPENKTVTRGIAADANGSYTIAFDNLVSGTYKTLVIQYVNDGVGKQAAYPGDIVVPAPSVDKPTIQVDKIYTDTLVVVGKTTPNLKVTVSTSYGNTQYSYSQNSGSDGVFRIPLTRTQSVGAKVRVTVTYGNNETVYTDVEVEKTTQKPTYLTLSRYKGSRGQVVLDLQRRLSSLGYTVQETARFDYATEEAVRQFQRTNGLDVDGIAGKNTQTLLYSVSAKPNGSPSPDRYPVLVRGDRGNAVTRLQQRLKDLGYYTIKVDGIYGVGTQSAVRAFQRRNSLTQTGTADNYTQQVLFSSAALAMDDYDTNYVYLSRGSRGSAVTRLQSRLAALGYYYGSLDGIYGSATQTAVRRFQSRNGIRSTGNADVNTQVSLFSSSAISNGSSSGSSVGYVYLHYGSRGTAVTRLQQALKDKGYLKGKVDGIYGDQTYDAVKAFQRAKGLSVDGIAGRKTQNALYGTNY